tara:strand:- start:369 stop:1631 length:1263 start_codon:yes stop_codon:yes gene_type:complete
MGEFAYLDSIENDKHRSGPYGNRGAEIVYFQWVPATVVKVVLNDDRTKNPDFDGIQTINCIKVRKHISDGLEEVNKTLYDRKLYTPLLRGMCDTPIKGDLVLTTTIGSNHYYLGPVNTLNTTNFNPALEDPSKLNTQNKHSQKHVSKKDLMGISPNYKIKPVRRMQKSWNPILDTNPEGLQVGEEGSVMVNETHGDMILEGRYGNSIRLGSRSTMPNIIISNGRGPIRKSESLSDESLISITSGGSLTEHFGNFELSCNTREDNPRMICDGNLEEERSFDKEFGSMSSNKKSQIFIKSDRITFDSLHNYTISAFHNIDIGAGNNVTMNSKEYVSIESSNIYLGKQAQDENEPLVLGSQLKEILKLISDILKNMKMTGCIAGLSGPPDPATLSSIVELTNLVTSDNFLSDYHFIEENGQKA